MVYFGTVLLQSFFLLDLHLARDSQRNKHLKDRNLSFWINICSNSREDEHKRTQNKICLRIFEFQFNYRGISENRSNLMRATIVCFCLKLSKFVVEVFKAFFEDEKAFFCAPLPLWTEWSHRWRHRWRHWCMHVFCVVCFVWSCVCSCVLGALDREMDGHWTDMCECVWMTVWAYAWSWRRRRIFGGEEKKKKMRFDRKKPFAMSFFAVSISMCPLFFYSRLNMKAFKSSKFLIKFSSYNLNLNDRNPETTLVEFLPTSEKI